MIETKIGKRHTEEGHMIGSVARTHRVNGRCEITLLGRTLRDHMWYVAISFSWYTRLDYQTWQGVRNVGLPAGLNGGLAAVCILAPPLLELGRHEELILSGEW
jgi:hypothetical protein